MPRSHLNGAGGVVSKRSRSEAEPHLMPAQHHLQNSNPRSARSFFHAQSPLMTKQRSPLQLLRIWTAIGMQSFGGGSATLYLIRRVAVERHHWITDEDFTRYWGICQIAPGINILGLVALIGWRVAGAVGVAVSLTGLLLPSASITVALTAVYASVR